MLVVSIASAEEGGRGGGGLGLMGHVAVVSAM